MSWLQLTLHADPASAEGLSALLETLGAASVTLQDAADQPLYEPDPGTTPLWQQTQVVALFPADTDMQPVYRALEAASPDGEAPAWRLDTLEDQDWERAWMDDFKPMRFGRRLWIVPSWHEPPDPGAVNLLLDPGLAFGTGTHPTTALCLTWLDAQDVDGKQVIDFGCGSGVLAIAAAKLGAARVLGTDIDPQALQATRDNAARNEVSERIEVFLPSQMPAARVDVLLANILAGPLEELAPLLAGHVRPGGLIVLSGILEDQAGHLQGVYAEYFDMEPVVLQEGWARLSGVRKKDI